MSMPDEVLRCLKQHVGKLIRDADLVKATGSTLSAVANHVSQLRSRGHVIDRIQRTGWVYVGQRGRTLATHRDHDEAIGESYRPEHVGDPLLDRLIAVHGRDVVDRNAL